MAVSLSTSLNPAAQLQNCLRNVESLIRAGDTRRAMALAADAVERGQEHVNLLTLAAHEWLRRGDAEKALGCAMRAREIALRNPDALDSLGLALIALGRPREALPVYNSALRQASGAAHLHFHKGQALEAANELLRAKTAYERALDLQPDNAEVLARLANLAALRGDAETARRLGERALTCDPRATAAPLAIAMADIQERKFEDATARLAPLARDANAPPVNRAIVQSLMGDALDGLDRTVDAFAAYAASNATLKEIYCPVYEAPGLETAKQRLERSIAYFRAAPRHWGGTDRDGAKSPVQTHAFLIGFPRSGTTLMEQIIGSHPDVQTMSERDCLLDAANEFVLPPDGFDRLSSLDDAGLERWRDNYWTRAAEFGASPERAVFVDKMPLNSVQLCLVARLFPDAKILFAMRDPRDAVLSCFRRRFGMTAQMYELLSLEGAARYYDSVMRLVQLYREKLDLQFHELRYESLVLGFESETRKVCAFLDLPWDESLRDFAARARSGNIDTPSAAQVARGLYGHGTGQWRRFREQLAPVLPILAPWVHRFGYEKD